jgi:hypothetical protein
MATTIRFASGAYWIFAFVRIWFVLRHTRLFLQFRRRTGKFPDIALPRSIDEKFLWRKVLDHNPLFITATDKLKSKAYARSKCPELHFAEVLWSGADPREIPGALLREHVVIKANHGSHWYVVLDGGRVDRSAIERTANDWLSDRYGADKGEWAYEHVDRSILIEKLLTEGGARAYSEYKFHIGCGRTSYVYFNAKRGTPDEREIVLARDGQAFAIDDATETPLNDFPLPANFLAMRTLAERLAAEFDFVRCDLYNIDGAIYFSELTVYPTGGYGTVRNRILSSQRNRDWDLLRSWFLISTQQGWRRRYAEALRGQLNRERQAGSAA